MCVMHHILLNVLEVFGAPDWHPSSAHWVEDGNSENRVRLGEEVDLGNISIISIRRKHIDIGEICGDPTPGSTRNA